MWRSWALAVLAVAVGTALGGWLATLPPPFRLDLNAIAPITTPGR